MFGFRTHTTALWPMEQSSILSAKFDCSATRQNCSLFATAHDCDIGLFIQILGRTLTKSRVHTGGLGTTPPEVFFPEKPLGPGYQNFHLLQKSPSVAPHFVF